MDFVRTNLKGAFDRCSCAQNPHLRLVNSGFSHFATPKNPSFKLILKNCR